MIRRTRRLTLFPYTTLFRSPLESRRLAGGAGRQARQDRLQQRHGQALPREGAGRSEEHTSELQSLTNIVCRLLLENKTDERVKPTNPLSESGNRDLFRFDNI